MELHAGALDVQSLRQLTDGAQVPRLLHAAVARERALEAELDKVVARQEALQRKMSQLAASTSESLQFLAVEADTLCETTASSAEMAERVSEQIRALDLTQARVQATIDVIDGLLGQVAAAEGLTRAMKSGDFEEAAHKVDEYLQLEEAGAAAAAGQGLAQSDPSATPPVEMPSVLSGEQAEAFNAARAQLESEVASRLEAAAAAADHEAVSRFAALCPLLRQGQRGLDVLVGFLAKLIAERAKEDNESLIASGASGQEPDFVGALTGLFKDIAAAIDEHLDLFVESFGPELAMTAILRLHSEVDMSGTRLLQRYADHRRLGQLVAQVSSHRGAGGFTGSGALGSSRSLGALASAAAAPIESGQVEGCLEELLELCSRSEQYLQYVLMRLADVAPPGTNGVTPGQREASLRGGSFATAVRELLGSYLSLEEYYVEESVAKAIRISDVCPGEATSSMVDDVFYVLARAGARALGTGRAPTAVAVLNAVHAALTTRLCAALEEGLVGAPGRLLAARQRAEAGRGSLRDDVGGVGKGTAAWAEEEDPTAAVDPEIAAAAAPFNDVEVTGSHAAKLRSRLEGLAGASFPAAADRDRVLMVLGDLAKVTSDVRGMASQAAAALSSALMASLRPALDAVAAARDLGGGSPGSDEGPDPLPRSAASGGQSDWALALAAALERAIAWLRPLLVPSLEEVVAGRVLDGAVARLEAAVAARRFSQLGGLALERDVRFLAACAAELAQRPVREKFARLGAMALLLGLESPNEVADLWTDHSGGGGGLGLRLSQGEARTVLAQRRDWTLEAIASVRFS